MGSSEIQFSLRRIYKGSIRTIQVHVLDGTKGIGKKMRCLKETFRRRNQKRIEETKIWVEAKDQMDSTKETMNQVKKCQTKTERINARKIYGCKRSSVD